MPDKMFTPKLTFTNHVRTEAEFKWNCTIQHDDILFY